MSLVNSLPTICFKIFESQQQLGYAIRSNASQDKIKEIMDKISQSYEEYDNYCNQKKQKKGFLGIERNTWKYIQLGFFGFTVFATLPPLGVAVASSVDVNSTYPQTAAVLATNIFSTSFALFCAGLLGTYQAIESMRKDYEVAQDSKLDEAQSLSKFWNIYKDFDLAHNTKDTTIEMDSSKVNATLVKINSLFGEIKVASEPNLDHDLANRIQLEIEQTAELKERLLSLLVQKFPKNSESKRAFTENERINNNYIQKDSPINEESGSSSYREGFLDVKAADKEPLNLPSNLNVQSIEDICETYSSNLNVLSEQFGFKVSKLYFDNSETKAENITPEEI
ncbi:MAG: hypothetical protein H0W50_08580 [Parachlamydiaceae bacterium]|nr:hypothetical protein [Parachlamydiaceae bacterium]